MPKEAFLWSIFNTVKVFLRPKNKLIVLVPFKLFVALNTWKRKTRITSKPKSKVVYFNQKLGTDSLMAYTLAVNCRSDPFKKLRKKSYHFKSFRRLTKTTTFS